ncbi:MAG: hypothetical protein KAH33_01480 [Candidatus Delongbacteria bacterium]|nr:hypothetical protein [Candidatus Delongbacteria bacterium]
MKKLNYFLMSLIIFSSMIFYSCHTETPVNVDHESPEIEILTIYNSTDTLYNSADTMAYEDFDKVIVTGDYTVLIYVEDNRELYKVSLFAEDAVNGESYLIESKNVNDNGEIEFVINKGDFPIVQNEDIQKFYLSLTVSDETENISISSKLGFYVVKESILEKLYDELGPLENTESDSIDFRGKIGKLTFIQFLAKG